MNYYWNWNSFLDNIPNFILAVVVLIIGWIIAKFIEKASYKGLKKTNLDNKIFRDNPPKYSTEKIISKVIYYLLVIFVFTLFFNILNLTVITSPLVNMLSSIFGAIPNILKAALILLCAWLIASGLRYIIKKTGTTLKVQEKLTKWKLSDHNIQQTKLMDNIANIVFYLVLLLFLPAVLDALNLYGVSEPFATMIQNILAFLPKLLAASLIILVGWFVAKIVRTIVTSFLRSIGTEKLATRLGMNKILDRTSLSAIIGNLVFILILIPVIISALEKLDIEGISTPAINMLNDILTMIPNIAVAIALLLIAVWLGKWIKQIVITLLVKLGLDAYIRKMGLNSNTSISNIIGSIVQILIIFLFAVQALNIVGLQFLVTLSTAIIAYLPMVIAAIIILAVGIWLGLMVQKLLESILQGAHFKLLPSIAKYIIITLSVFMALDQLKIAPSIVNSAFILILGGLALAFGLAFGLGGKEFAQKRLAKLDNKIDQTMTQKPNEME